MKSILTKLNNARSFVRELSTQKKGRNNFAKYDYFQPDDIADWTQQANIKYGIVDVYNNEITSEGNYVCNLSLFCIETCEQISFQQVTAKPEIKATNEAQKMGGMLTYSNRYILQTAYKIAENSTDSDAHDNRKSSKKANEPENWLNAYKSKGSKEYSEDFIKVMKAVKAGTHTVSDVRKKYKVSKETETLINTLNK